MTQPSIPSSAKSQPKPGEPYCGNCGYVLVGLEDSARCPECGKPIVQVLMRKEFVARLGKRYRSKATLMGLPVIDIALGPSETEMRGKARGIIAIGDTATGWLAIGGIARGIVAIGGMSIGVFALGGMSIGLLTALGGLAAAVGLAAGGGAVGGIATGGSAVGIIAQGGGAWGVFTRDGSSWGRAAPAIFGHLKWFLGDTPAALFLPMLVPLLLTVSCAALIGIIAYWHLAHSRAE